MLITRGLTNVISKYSVLEQKYILEVAAILEKNKYPMELLTRVHLHNKVETLQDYYTYNEITFFINPGIYNSSYSNLGVDNIGVGWEDPSVIRRSDGGIEFELGKRVKPEDLEIFIYRLQKPYTYNSLLKDQDGVLEKINNVLLRAKLEDAISFMSLGLEELAINHHILISPESEDIYQLVLRILKYSILDKSHYHPINELDREYKIRIDTKNNTVTLQDSHLLNFFPTPAIIPEPNRGNKRK